MRVLHPLLHHLRIMNKIVIGLIGEDADSVEKVSKVFEDIGFYKTSINPKIKDPIVRDERSGDMSMTDEERELQASRARRGISGPKDILEDYE